MFGYKVTMAAARVNAGHTQGRLAEMMDLSKQTIINWESGASCPDPYNFLVFCEICNVHPDMVVFVSD